jgi:CheY-like chemotaxis protein
MIAPDPTILLMAESDNDALHLGAAFDRAGLGQPLRYARDRAQAKEFLSGKGDHAERGRLPTPTVLLIEMSTPGREGFELLRWVSRQPELRPLRVYVLGVSNRLEDIRLAYELGASAYLVKAPNRDDWARQTSILITWLKLCHFPSRVGTDEERAIAVLAARPSD